MATAPGTAVRADDAHPPAAELATAIKDLEHVCDKHTRSIIDRLNRTFVTPLDREDIHSLAIALDDVMDAVDSGAAITKAGFGALIVAGWTKTLIFIVIAPIIGLVAGLLLMSGSLTVFRNSTPKKWAWASAPPTITGAIVGVGATRRLSAVRWGVAGQIVWAWAPTISAAAIIGAICDELLVAFSGAV